MAPILCRTVDHPPLILLYAESFFGVRKPACSRCSRVPPSTLESVHVTTVSRREPYSLFDSWPPCHEYTRRSWGITSSTSRWIVPSHAPAGVVLKVNCLPLTGSNPAGV